MLLKLAIGQNIMLNRHLCHVFFTRIDFGMKKLLFLWSILVTFPMRAVYVHSDLAFTTVGPEGRFAVEFCHREDALSADHDGQYVSAVLYGDRPLEGLHMEEYSTGLHYLCLEGTIDDYKDLKEMLKGVSFDDFDAPCPPPSQERTVHSYTQKSTLEDLILPLQGAKQVVITFGAGMSAGYVPTLPDFLKTLDLRKNPFDDCIEGTSFIPFVRRLFLGEKEHILQTINCEWGAKIRDCSVPSTPAHEALKNLVDVLRSQGKQTFVYTDNIDGIDARVQIPLAREEHCEQQEDGTRTSYTQIMYPPKVEGFTVVLICGQSFDFQGVLSTLRTQQKDLSLFALNTSSQAICLYQGLHVPSLTQGTHYRETFQQVPCFDVRFVEGSLQETLPQLSKMYQEEGAAEGG